MQRISFVYLLSFFLLVTILFTGCVQTGPTGKWTRDRDDAQVFESKTVLTGHTYYYRGNPITPESIIAIDNNFTLQTKVWSRVDITQKILDDWMYWIHTRPNISCPFYGGAIMTPDGRKAGIWYSRKLITTVTSPEPGVLQVYPPYSLPGSSCSRHEQWDDR